MEVSYNGENAYKTRILWIDLLKILGTFLVVMQHSISQSWVGVCGKNGSEWYVLNLIFMLSRMGVPLFFMCSGMMMLHKNRNSKEIFTHNIGGIVKTYISWMVLFGIVDSLQLTEPNIRIVINIFLKNILFGRYHTWFIITLIGLYIITPLLRKIVTDKESMEYFLVLSVLFTIIIPIIGEYDFLTRAYKVFEDMNMRFVVGYSLYFVLGYYLSILKGNNSKHILRGSLMMFFLSALAGYYISNQRAIEVGADCQLVYTEFSLLGFLMTVSIFLFFKSAFNRKISENKGKFISKLAIWGIGIYLFHPMLLPVFLQYKGLRCLWSGLCLYGVCVVIMFVVSKIPVIKNLLLNIR